MNSGAKDVKRALSTEATVQSSCKTDYSAQMLMQVAEGAEN